MSRLFLIGVVLAAIASGLVWAGERGWGPLVITPEGEQKLVLFLGDPWKVTTPGLDWRIPGLHDVRTFERRLLYLNTEPLPIQTKDEERIQVDNYVVWRIVDPTVFFAKYPAGQSLAESEIDRVVRADVRAVIGRHTLDEVLTGKRAEIMQEITRESQEDLAPFGIEVRDVRINRTELPEGTENSVYARMKTDRERLARKYRAEGEEAARRIRAEADRAATVIVANARRDAEISRGRGDAEATRIYAEAYSSDPEFYAFMRSLKAYESTLGDRTTLVLSPRAEFFRFLESADPAHNGGAAK